MVAKALRELALSEAAGDGMRLPSERELAERFGVSRVVVREAVRTLESDGLLKVKKGASGGTFVCRDLGKPLATSISNLLQGGSINLTHLFELRLMLEPPATAQAALRATPAQLAVLEQILADSRAAFDDENLLRRLNLDFHRHLARMADNPLLAFLCDKVLDLMVERIKARTCLSTSQAVVPWHQRILAALQAGDPAAAGRCTEQELGCLLARYRQLGLDIGRPERQPEDQ
ncbi:MAG: FadR/GntR family transcriptional regulator [Pseudomonadota bacterium]